MNKYLSSGKDIENPEQMKEAIESFEGIPGVKVIVCALPAAAKSMAGEWDGVSQIKNIEYKNESMTVRMAYNIGPGKVIPLTNFCQSSTVPKLIYSKETEDAVSFVTVKARQQPKESHKQNCADPNEDESKDESVDTCSKLFLCPEQGCLKSFQRYSSLEKHLHFENHNYVLEHETLYDKAMKLYATKTEEGSRENLESTENDGLPKSDTGPQLQKGWALKTYSKRKRFSDIQKKFLLDVFDAGEQTGQKADPADVSKAMRSARNSDGSRLFGKSDFLTPQQIASFFSRLAKKRRGNAAGDKDNKDGDVENDGDCEEDDVNRKDFQKREEQEIEQLSASLIDAIGLKHPIMFDRHNICELTSQRKLSKFSVCMVQEICASLTFKEVFCVFQKMNLKNI